MSFDLKDGLGAALRLAPRLVLISLVFLFCAHWIVLAHYAVDIPFLDDWRPYDAGDAGSFALSRLIVSSNDTLYPVGKFLDALNVRLFAGDNVIYQIISFAGVMGGLLFLQYALLRRYAPSAMALGVAALSLVFMLQPRSYWGAQSLAYDQALPLIALLGGLSIAVASRVAIGAKVALIILITALGGLAYISGAFAAAAVALFAVAFWWRLGPGREQAYRAAALGFGLGAALSLPAQLWVIMVVQHGQTHRPDAPWSSPLHWEFWRFIVGITGRAIGFSGTTSGLAFVASLIVAVAALALLLILLRPLANRTTNPDDDQFAFVYGAICVAILVYLGMVAAGRTNFGRGDVEQTVLGFFQLGQARFYFLWVTVLLPWMVLAVLRLANGTRRTLPIAAAASLTLLLLINYAGNGKTIFGLVPIIGLSPS